MAPESTRRRRAPVQPDGRHQIALVGFMAAGKSTVGKTLAAQLGWRFVDLDEVIVAQAGRSIPEIFKEQGEVGFRARERAALREVLNEPEPTVLATGGGTFGDPQNRELINRHARSVYLRASADTLLSRIDESGREGRPMLKGPDPEATLRRLLSEREASYELCELTVPTDGLPVDEVAQEVVSLLRLDPHGAERRQTEHRSARPSGTRPVIEVHSSLGSYPVELRREAGLWIAQAIAERTSGRNVAVISDETVAPLHAQRLVDDLRARGKEVTLHTVPVGEGSKSLETAGRLYDELLGADFTRRDAAVAVGGGVVGDLTGFVASTLLRGIRYFQVPTTTLAAVDSSVGGKTAVNTPRGKNLVGTFYPPRGVFIAAAHLATQSRRQHAAGLAEALKMAATLDAQLFEDIEARAEALLAFEPDTTLSVVSRALQLKAAVVARDEKESGERAVLNYGHTVGHAIESGELYRLLHGEAVALGMVAEAEWAQGEGMPKEVCRALREALESLELPTEWTEHQADVRAMGLDKKRLGTSVRLPMVPKIGTFELRSVPLAALVEFVQRRTP